MQLSFNLEQADIDKFSGRSYPRDHYLQSSIASTDSIVADYRATAGIDLDMDAAADRERGAS